jgi:hypothetical protein
MRTILFILFIFNPLFVRSQDVATEIADFNDDGHIDTLRSWSEGGSGFGGKYCQIINGATNEKYKLNTYGCFCRIKKTVLIPQALQKEQNRPFLEAIKNQILPARRESADPSLSWIIKANQSPQILSNTIYFDLIISSPTEWHLGTIKLPDTYYIDVIGNSEHPIKDSDSDKTTAWLIYYGHNHYRNPSGDSLTLTDSTQSYLAYKTSHGLIVKKGDMYAWLFVNDFELTGGPGKLRWESIQRVQLYGNYAILQQSLAPDMSSRIFLIDIETGMCARMKFITNLSDFKIENNQLILENDEGEKSFSMKSLFKELHAHLE